MGRWVTSKGRRVYILDEGEENPFSKSIDREMAEKDRQIAANRQQAIEKNKEEIPDWRISDSAAKKQLELDDKKYASKQAKKDAEYRATSMIPSNAEYSDIYNKLKSLGLAEVFKKKLELRGNTGKSYAVIARAVIADAIQKGKI